MKLHPIHEIFADARPMYNRLVSSSIAFLVYREATDIGGMPACNSSAWRGVMLHNRCGAAAIARRPRRRHREATWKRTMSAASDIDIARERQASRRNAYQSLYFCPGKRRHAASQSYRRLMREKPRNERVGEALDFD